MGSRRKKINRLLVGSGHFKFESRFISTSIDRTISLSHFSDPRNSRQLYFILRPPKPPKLQPGRQILREMPHPLWLQDRDQKRQPGGLLRRHSTKLQLTYYNFPTLPFFSFLFFLDQLDFSKYSPTLTNPSPSITQSLVSF